MVAQAVELFEFGIIYEQREAIKAQALIDIVVEMTKPEGNRLVQRKWTLYVNGSSNSKGSGISIILEGSDNIIFKYSLKFDFKVMDNQMEYEVLVAIL